MTKRFLWAAGLAAGVFCVQRPAHAQEVCGDGQDNTTDTNDPGYGIADEGCFPAGVTGVCESPLSCSRTGYVAPRTGGLVYHLPPDVSPTVPYGPPIAFQRTYLSLYEPGYDFGAGNNRWPLGLRWHHNFMSWIDDSDATDTGDCEQDEVVVHTTKGQDILFSCTSNSGGYDYYSPQVPHHFDYLRRENTSDDWELRSLTGTVYEYGNRLSGNEMLAGIVDSAGNTVVIGYADFDGVEQIETVTDAVGNKYLLFGYQGSGGEFLDTVEYYTENGASDTLEVTLSFTYTANNTLSTALIDSTGIGEYGYDAAYNSEYLTEILDGDGTTIASFLYDSTTQGQVARLETGIGDIGYEYDSKCAGTESDTVSIFYHRDSITSCDADADCGTGLYCGGMTDGGATQSGTCYKVEQCVVLAHDAEDIVEAVTASCNSCRTVQDYAWDTAGGILELIGLRSADGVWTSYERNSDGLVTKMVEGDTDSDAATEPAGSRVTYYFYNNASFPGKVTEIRRLSELKPSGTCNVTTTTECKRTNYTYNANGRATAVRERGYTYSSAAAPISFDATTSYSYDTTTGQLTQIVGPSVTNQAQIDFEYHTEGWLLAGHLKTVKIKNGSTSTLDTTYDNYNEWGQAEAIEDPNGDWTCLDFDDHQGYVSEVRVARNNQTSCTTVDAIDYITEYERDTWGRLTQVTHPAGSCTFYGYDGEGRLSSIKPRDDCLPASDGDTMAFTYSLDGLQTKVEYLDENDTVTYRQEKTYYDDRRVHELKNPVQTSYSRSWEYADDGMPTALNFENSLGETEWTYDDLNRQELIRRYTGISSYNEWDITPGVQLDLATSVQDDDAKAIDWVWDDLGRKVQQTTPDSGTTTYVYDAAGRMTTKIEADGDAGEVTTLYTYDHLGRVLSEDSDLIDCDDSSGGTNTKEVQYWYDDNSTCPTGKTCENLLGQLARVRVRLFCDPSQSDDSFDQNTYYSYSSSGQLRFEYLRDNGSREEQLQHVYVVGARYRRLHLPSGFRSRWSYNSSTTNSDMYRARRTDQYDSAYEWVVDIATFLPFGPLDKFRQHHTQNGNMIIATLDRNLAYRPTQLLWEEDTSGTDLLYPSGEPRHST